MIDLKDPFINKLLEEIARRGAEHAINDITCYTKTQACELLGISYSTLQRRISERRIKVVDGRIPGMMIRKYLTEQIRDR